MEDISLIYYVNFVTLSFLAVFYNKNAKGLLYLAFVYLSLLVAIRHNVGNDYVNYVRLFDETSFKTLFNDATEVEYGAFGSMALFRRMGFGIPYWFFTMSFMTFFTLFKGLERMGFGNIWWSLLIYYSFFFLMNHCNIMQHGVMTGWIWLAFSYINSNPKKYFIYCLIGASFHILGLFFIPFYWILRRNISVKIAMYAFGFAIVFNFFFKDLLFSFLNFGYIGYKIQYYSSAYFQGQEINKSISLGVIVYFFLLLLLYLFKIERKSENFNVLRNALLLSIFFQVGFKGTGIFDARIGGVFNISLVILIPLFLNYLAPRFFYATKVVVLIYAFLLFVVTSTNPSN